MQEIKYGSYVISADIEKTKEYYAHYIRKETQANRNFEEYCRNLSEEEKYFFDSFGINPVCCDIEHIGVSRKGDFPCGGYYLIYGSYLEHPQINPIPLEEFVEQGFEANYPDPRVNVGIFEFDFLLGDDPWDDEIPEMPEGFICVRFWCEDMKWLLEESCEEKMYEPPRFWEIHKIILEKVNHLKQMKASNEEFKEEFTRIFDKLGIKSSLLPKKQASSYRKEWLSHFTPEEADWKKVKKICLKGCGCVYLWHLFSYEIVKGEEGQAAKELFEAELKEGCILFSNIGDFAFHLENAQKLSAEALEQFVDVTVTALDFSWTYSKTHEEELGPYFYRLQKES